MFYRYILEYTVISLGDNKFSSLGKQCLILSVLKASVSSVSWAGRWEQMSAYCGPWDKSGHNPFLYDL